MRAALRSDGPPKYERAPKGSVADGFEPRIRELLAALPTMPASVIGERIGWPYSDRTLRTKVAELRPVYLPPDPASRTSYAAGELAQDDFWFPDITLPVGFGQVRTAKQLPVLTMVSGYSRWASAVLIPTRNAEDLFAGWWQLISGRWGRCRGCWCGTGRARSAGTRTSSRPSARRSAAPSRPGCMCAGQPTRRPRGWSSGSTTTWSGRFCPAGRSRPRRISTPSSASGSRW